MEESEYSGVRVSLEAFLDIMRIPWKIDISTGDIITPFEISYPYKLMFEQRTISLWAYPLENVLAEKIETILVRATFNSRLRDFYDIYILQNIGTPIDISTLSSAIISTCRKRDSTYVIPEYEHILEKVETNQSMQKLWKNYQNKNSYSADISWEMVMESIRSICKICLEKNREK